MDFEQRYRVVESRDRRFDGQFFTAVRTTGIYCRPSCPARTPQRRNVEFFSTSAAAHQAGYRACKRCLPAAVPGTPAWNLREDITARAMRLIGDGVVEREGVDGLAARLGYSSRQLGRILTEQLGAGPLALARALRAQTARTLLTATDLTLAEVAFASGFASLRQFNDTVREVFDLTPSQLRSATAGTLESVPGEVRLRLARRDPYDAAGVLRFLGERALPGVEQATPNSYARTLTLPHGGGAFEVSLDNDELILRAHLEHLADLQTLTARVRRLFDLDADPAAVDEHLSRDPLLARSVAENPGIRLPGAVNAEEMVFRAIIGQQVTVASARGTLNALVTQAGVSAPAGLPGLDRLFPSAAQVAEHARTVFRGPAAKLATLERLATAFADGSLVLDVADTVPELRRKLVSFAGIGDWTAGYVAMRVLGSPDILLPTDAAVRQGARQLGVASLADRAARWAPWRSYACLHLWRAAKNRNRTDPKARP